jgi:uncharacterized protein YjbI with pentapeptide repeats
LAARALHTPSVKTHEGRPRRERPLALPHLADFDGEGLERDREYEATLFADRDFSGQDAGEARFLECRLERCCLDGLLLRRARLVDCLLLDSYGASLDAADSNWRGCHVSGGRLGAMTLAGATWTAMRLRGIKLGFLSLAGARLDDVVFEECEIEGLDARSAQLNSVAFRDCSLGELNVAGATLSKVDLSEARLKTLVGVESLRGAIVSHEQLLDLAPLLAAQLGLEVRPD